MKQEDSQPKCSVENIQERSVGFGEILQGTGRKGTGIGCRRGAPRRLSSGMRHRKAAGLHRRQIFSRVTDRGVILLTVLIVEDAKVLIAAVVELPRIGLVDEADDIVL